MGSIPDKAVGEGTFSLTKAQEDTSETLRSELSELASKVRSSRLKLPEKIKLMGTLVKSHESLVKAERSVAGLDQATGVAIGIGVILVPMKETAVGWEESAKAEIKRVGAESVEGEVDAGG